MAKSKTAQTSPLRRSPRKHASDVSQKKTARGKAAPEPELGTISWGAEDGKLIWDLLAQMQAKENRLVLFGKNAGTNENTKGNSKIIVYKRIGSVILPELYEKSPNTLAKRVKGKAEDLVKSYKAHAKKLQVTGGGLQDDQDEQNGDEDVHQYLEC
ncbi:hypothetical protein B0H11DRAFT_2300612 [Mycena galericulata]|nr:hypothetical protein B0H11DRAFT_2300612 [Mycena galericulata]